jgi:hypothetical protein
LVRKSRGALTDSCREASRVVDAVVLIFPIPPGRVRDTYSGHKGVDFVKVDVGEVQRKQVYARGAMTLIVHLGRVVHGVLFVPGVLFVHLGCVAVPVDASKRF